MTTLTEIENTIWGLQDLKGYDVEIRLFAVACARRAQHLMEDERSLRALDVAEAFANGKVSEEELQAAWEASYEARDDSWARAWETSPESMAAHAATKAAFYAAFTPIASAVWKATFAAAWAAFYDDCGGQAALVAERNEQLGLFKKIFNF